MTFAMALKGLIYVSVCIFLIVGFFNEDKFIRFEDKLIRNIARYFRRKKIAKQKAEKAQIEKARELEERRRYNEFRRTVCCDPLSQISCSDVKSKNNNTTKNTVICDFYAA